MAALAQGRTLVDCLADGLTVEVAETGPDYAGAGVGRYYAQLMDQMAGQHGEHAFGDTYEEALAKLAEGLQERAS